MVRHCLIAIFFRSALQSHLINECGLLDIAMSKLKCYKCPTHFPQTQHDNGEICMHAENSELSLAKLDTFEMRHTSMLGNLLIIAQVGVRVILHIVFLHFDDIYSYLLTVPIYCRFLPQL